METVAELLRVLPQVGRLEWMGAAAHRRAEIQILTKSVIRKGTGLAEDHHAKSGRSKRQVTLIQHEHLAAIAGLVQRAVSPEMLRRNLVVSGINLLALKNQRFQIGDVLLEGTGLCAPCSRMEEALGPGGYNAMRGHGGITARVLSGGTVQLGETVRYIAHDETRRADGELPFDDAEDAPADEPRSVAVE